MNKPVRMNVRFTESEAAAIRKIAGRRGVSEFIRLCVNTELARDIDPEAAKLLAAMFEKGINEFVGKRVKAAIREEKKKAG